MYWTVGRGIVNGLSPYVDLFDNKPPGMFLISALSFWLTDSVAVCFFLQSIILFLLPLTGIVPVIVNAQKKHRWLLVAIACLFSVSFTLFTGELGGEFQTESFGAFFACLYVAIIAIPRPMGRWRILAAGIALFATSFTKEPFFITCLAAALLLCKTKRAFFDRFIIPTGIGAILGVVVLWLLGSLGGYFSIYLPFQLGHEMQPGQSAFMRGWNAFVIGKYVWAFSPFFATGVLYLLIANTVALSLIPRVSSKRLYWISVMLLMELYYLFFALFKTVGLLITPPHRNLEIYWDIRIPFNVWHLCFMLLPAYCIFCCIRFQWANAPRAARWNYVGRLLAILAAPYLMIFAIGLHGSFKEHHTVFLVPTVLALFLFLIDALSQQRSKRNRTIVLSFIVGLGLILLPLPFTLARTPDYGAQQYRAGADLAFGLEEAARIDRIMTACSVDRYLIAGSGMTGLTKHSPHGPPFFSSHGLLGFPFLRDAFIANVHRTQLIVEGSQGGRFDWLEPEVKQYVATHFTNQPPPCAADLPLPITTTVLFRAIPDEGRDVTVDVQEY